MLVLRKHIPPGAAAVGGNKDPPIHRAFIPFVATPSRQVKAMWIVGINGEAIRAVHAFRQLNFFPVPGAVTRAIERSILRVPEAAVLAAARHYEIQDAVFVSG